MGANCQKKVDSDRRFISTLSWPYTSFFYELFGHMLSATTRRITVFDTTSVTVASLLPRSFLYHCEATISIFLLLLSLRLESHVVHYLKHLKYILLSSKFANLIVLVIIHGMGNQQASTMHEPQHSTDSRLMAPSTYATSQQLQGKSLIKRSRSIRSKDGGVVVDTSRFLPKGLHGGHGGLHMPTKPYADGYVSPDWGWYINTTPPTPEMYHSSSKVYLKKPSTYPAPPATTRRGPSALDSPAFSKGGKGGATHWPSVPI